jgi:hypothetical protein
VAAAPNEKLLLPLTVTLSVLLPVMVPPLAASSASSLVAVTVPDAVRLVPLA